VWAEWYRVLAEFAIAPDRQMPRDMWRWQVDAPNVADLSDATKLADVGLNAPRPSRREWAAFQTVGHGLFTAGFTGVLAPSAARPGHLLLCLFRDDDVISGASPVRPPIIYRHVPPPPPGMTT
jgi:hypothetical protein